MPDHCVIGLNIGVSVGLLPKNHFIIIEQWNNDFSETTDTGTTLWILVHQLHSSNVMNPERSIPLPDELLPIVAKAISDLVNIPDLNQTFRIRALVDLILGAALSEANDNPFPVFTDYVREHLHSTLTTESIAVGLGMNENKLLRLVSCTLDTTPAQYVRRERILLAQQLLANTTASIESIAEQTHYSDRFAFTRAFQLATSISPGQFRKQYATPSPSNA